MRINLLGGMSRKEIVLALHLKCSIPEDFGSLLGVQFVHTRNISGSILLIWK